MRWAKWILGRTIGRNVTVKTRRRTTLQVQPLEDRSVPTVSGTVFRDYNQNGIQDAREPGVAGVTVSAFDSTGAAAGAAVVTNALGQYTLGTNLTAVRVEFTGLPAFLRPGVTTASGAGAAVQFVNASTNPTGVNLNVNNPFDHSEANPYMVTPRYVMGDGQDGAGPDGATPALIAFRNNESGLGAGAQLVPLATAAQIGSTWAVGWNKATRSVYAGAFLKRHMSFGPNGTGAIYRIQPTFDGAGNITGSSVSLFADLSVLLGGAAGGANNTTGTVAGRTGDATLFSDGGNAGTVSGNVPIWDAVGKIGIGGIAVSEDNTRMFVVNLNTRELVEIGIDAAGNSTGLIRRTAIPGTAANTDLRPFAVAVRDGQVFVGLVNSAQSTGVRSQLDGQVFSFNPATGTFSGAPVLQFDLDYDHGAASVDENAANRQPNNGFFQTWNALDNGAAVPGAPSISAHGTYRAQPMLTDIAFDSDGHMSIGIRDRQGDQNSQEPGVRLFGTAGDVLRAAPNGVGGFVIETNGTVGSLVGLNPPQSVNEGPGGSEFYTGDRYRRDADNTPDFHREISLGGLHQIAGAADLAVSAFDPFVNQAVAQDDDELFSGGALWLSNTNGGGVRGFTVYNDEFNGDIGDFFGKLNGVGDLQALSAAAPIEIGDRVWVDTDGDGIQDAGEAGIAGVQVLLFQGAVQVGTATTDANGYYRFNASNVTGGVLPNTTYQLRVASAQASLSGRVATLRQQGANTELDSDGLVSGANVVIDVTTGAVGTNIQGADYGFVSRLSIGNRVFNDTNNNGVRDVAEAGVSGVRVELYDGAGAFLNFVNTDANGYYSFTGLNAGNYRVRLAAVNFNAAQPLTGFASSTGTNGSATGNYEGALTPDPNLQNPPLGNFDADDNGTTSGVLGSGGFIETGLITLSAGTAPTGEADPGVNPDPTTSDANSNFSVDFGVFRQFSLGNTVFNDANNNGSQDGTEAGIAGVTVRLLDATGTTQIGLPVVTDAQGRYLFSGLSSGDYLVEVTSGNFTGAGTLVGLISSTGTSGSATGPNEAASDPDVNVADLDDNGTTTPVLGAGGVVRSSVVTLGPNADEPLGEVSGVDPTNAPDNQSNLTVDFGFFRPLSLGNRIWNDVNNDGFLNGTEAGVANGVVVELLNASGAVIATTATTTVGADAGNYRFDNLGAGDYRVRLAASNFNTGGLLVGFTSSGPTVSDPNSNIDNDDNGLVTGTLGSGGVIESSAAQLITLTAGAETEESGNANLRLDFGVVRPMSLGNLVYRDLNNNGLFDPPTESGIANVLVRLLDATGTIELATSTTNASGLYLFPNLAAGTYIVEVAASNFTGAGALLNLISSTGTPGSATGPNEGAATPDPDTVLTDNDDNGDTAAGVVRSRAITLGDTAAEPTGENPNNDTSGVPDGQSNLTVDFGFLVQGSLSGRVFVDVNANGLREGTETTFLPGVTITVSGPAIPAPIVVVTGADGSYSVPSLPPGTYTVTQTQPPGYGSSTPNAVANVVVPPNGSAVVDFGETVGSLAGRVWLNYDNQPTFNGLDAPISGVLITLTGTDAAGAAVNRTTTTDATGNYLFDNVLGGTYQIQEGTTTGGLFPPSTDGIDFINAGPAVVPDADRHQSIVLAAAQNLTGFNFTEVPLQEITGFVYEDRNADCFRQPTEPGIAGVTVVLTGTDVTGSAVNQSVVTDANGQYRFTNVRPGTNYTITEQQATVPATFVDGCEENGTPPAGTVGNDVFNGISTVGTSTNIGGYNFGEVRPVSVAGSVYVDANNDGIRQGTETGISNVQVRLTGTDFFGTAVSLTVDTDATGNYLFNNLLPGTYTVSEPTQPTGFGDGLDTAGTRGGTAGNDIITGVVLQSGDAATGYNFGERSVVDIQVTHTIDRSLVRLQDTVVMIYTVRNNGPSTATNVVMNTQFPAGLVPLSFETAGVGTFDPTAAQWNIGTLTNGQSVVMRVRARVTRTGILASDTVVQTDQTETTLINNFDGVTVQALRGASNVTKRRFLSRSR